MRRHMVALELAWAEDGFRRQVRAQSKYRRWGLSQLVRLWIGYLDLTGFN
jgi:hypothetical protein